MAKNTKAKKTKETAATRALASLGKVRGGLDKHQVQLDRRHLTAVWPHIPPGNIKFEYILGGPFDKKGRNACPGYPRGRVTNVYGAEHCGKTTLSLHAAAETCAAGGCVGYIDYEHALDIRYAAKLGVPVHDQSQFLLFQPETLEQGVAIVVGLACQKMDLIVLDSVGAAIPKTAFELSIEDIMKAESKALGLQARAWSGSIPLMLYHLKMGGTAMIAIAQQRDSISPMQKSKTVQGGNAWKYYSSVRLEMRQVSQIKGSRYNPLTHKVEKEAVVGTNVLVKVKKAKISGTSNYEAVVECIPNMGFDPFRASVDLAIVHGIIHQSGSWYTWDHPKQGEIRHQGRQKFSDELYKIPGVHRELDKLIRPHMSAQDVSPTGEDEEPDYHDEEGSFIEGEEGSTGVSVEKLAAIADGKDFSVPEED